MLRLKLKYIFVAFLFFFIKVTTSNFSVVVKYLDSQVIQSMLPRTANKHKSELIIAILRFSLYFDVGHHCELVHDSGLLSRTSLVQSIRLHFF